MPCQSLADLCNFDATDGPAAFDGGREGVGLNSGPYAGGVPWPLNQEGRRFEVRVQ
jgi:hypothetical protein